MRLRLATATTACVLLACPSRPAPGVVSFGVYALVATPVLDDGTAERMCQLDAGADAGYFAATLTSDVEFGMLLDGGAAWMTLSEQTREASWDGQTIRSTARAQRSFPDCGGCATSVVETIAVALLSSSQARSLGFRCPAQPLDGGLPADDADAGLARPTLTGAGFDAVMACGELRAEVVLADAGACASPCVVCRARFEVTGLRR